MAYSSQTREQVRRMYIEGMPLSGAAAAHGVGYDTARSWKAAAKNAGDDWDTARAAFCISEQGVDALNQMLVENFARQAVSTTRLVETNDSLDASTKVALLAQLADAYAKFSKSFSRINPEYSGLSVALDTLKVLVEHLKMQDKAALLALMPHIEALGGILGKRHGKK